MALVGWIWFKEKIRTHHLIGCVMLIACAAIISLSDENSNATSV